MAEKQLNYTLLSQGEVSSPPRCKHARGNRRIWHWTVAGLLIVAAIFAVVIAQTAESEYDRFPISNQPACPQYPASKSSSDERRKLEEEIRDELNSDAFFDKSLKKLQGAIHIPTESFDDMGPVEEDPRWDVFADFHAYLKEAFPLVHSKLDITAVNKYGILIEWKGKDESLKPYLFMAHQDVVPVLQATRDKWTYPPFSAHFDGRYVWGRGATDCKNNLIGVFEAFETLLEKDFTPERSVMAAFGFDEEISGPQGAKFLAAHIEKTRGKDSIELIVDEGGLGFMDIYGALFAMPAVGEKGYIDVTITVETSGGHSSVPPDNSGIGILSQIITAIEAKPYSPDLTPINPYFTTLQCAAEYGPDMDSKLRKAIKEALGSKKAAKSVATHLANQDIAQRYLMQTSQAVDIISGGVKINALPEKVYAVVNHRIAVESSTSDIKSHVKSVISSEILPKFSFSLDAWGDISGNTSDSSVGRITLSTFDATLEPAPVSPSDTDAYKTFTGTIKQVFGKDVIVAPSLMTGNTDTKFYWGLTKNIYRFSPVRADGRENAHTVDERIGLKEHIEGVKFYTQLILNGDV